MARAVARTSLVAGSIALALALCPAAVAQGAAGTGGQPAPARALGTGECPPDCPPAAPTGLQGKVPTPRVVTLTWKASTDPAFARYEVWRNTNRDTSRTDWMPMAGFPTRPTYRDVVPDLGTFYYYVVEVNVREQRSPPSPVVAVHVPGPPIPTGLRASVSGKTVTLAWNGTSNPRFSHFQLWRDTQPDVEAKTWTRVGGRFTAPAATDTPGVGRFWYYVTHHSEDGNFSDQSSPVHVDIVPDPDRDRDDDGAEALGFGGNDCDDDNAGVRPGLADVTNGFDDDCDGVVDPNGPQDRDSDGVNASPFGDDCNDANAAMRPGVRDVTNAVDDDCDGVIDPDVDGDGFVRGPQQDCNDGDRAIRPGTLEVRGNRVDENCDGRAEPLPRIETRMTLAAIGGPTTRVIKLRALDVPANARIAVRCRGGGCPRSFTQRLKNARKAHSLTARFRRARLRPGAVLEVSVTAPNLQGRRWRYEFRRNRGPKTSPSFIGDGYR